MTETQIQGEGATLNEALAQAINKLGVDSPDDMDWDYQREHFRGGAYSVLVTAKSLDPGVIKQRKADEALLGDAKDWLRSMMNWFHNSPGLQIRSRGDTTVLNLVDAEDARLFIGREGKNMPAFQHLFGKVMAKSGTEGKVAIDFDGYVGERDSELEDTIRNAIDSVLDTGDSVTLHPMNAYERHLVHSMVKETGGLESNSVGEGSMKSVKIERDDG
jgi:spoIIIJ-associated protein